MAMFQEKSSTIGKPVIIELGNGNAHIVGKVPGENIKSKCKFNDARAAKILREQNFCPEKAKQQITALIGADFEDGVKDNSTYGVSKYSNDQKKALNESKKARKNNNVYLYDLHKQEFPVGLVSHVGDILHEQGINFTIKDTRVKPEREYEWPLLDGWEDKARDYQADGSSMTDKHPRMLFDWATNAGKTLLMSLIVSRRGVKTLILTHSGVLARQVQKAFVDYLDYRPAVLDSATSSKKRWKLKPITIAVVNSARNKAHELKEYGFDMIMVDEAHRSAAVSYAKVCSLLDTYYMYGFSGTAYRNDDSGIVLEAQYGRVRPKITNTEMINKGFSCPVHVDIREVTIEANKEDTYQLIYKNAITTNPIFNSEVAHSVLEDVALGRQVIIQVAHKIQGKILWDILNSCDVKVCVVDGDSSAKSNYMKLEMFKNGDYDVAVGTILNEGFDFDGLDVVVNAAGMKAKGVVAQKIGRVLRHREGKVGIFRDFFVHGHHILWKHSKERCEALEAHGFDVPILERIRREEKEREEQRLRDKAKTDAKFKELMEEQEKRIEDDPTLKKEYNKKRFSGVALVNIESDQVEL